MNRDMGIFLIAAGIASTIYGTITIMGRTKNDLSNDSMFDKKMLSEETRYFVGRYYAGLQFIIAGLGAVVLGIILLPR